MKQTITRKDGITYQRIAKEKKYDDVLFLRLKKEKTNRIREIAEKKGVSYCDLIRDKIDEIIEEYEGE